MASKTRFTKNMRKAFNVEEGEENPSPSKKEKPFLKKAEEWFKFHFTGDKDLGKTISKEMKKPKKKK